MARKIDDPESAAPLPDSFFTQGRNLRKAYDKALTEEADPVAMDLLKLLLETSPHDMGSC